METKIIYRIQDLDEKCKTEILSIAKILNIRGRSLLRKDDLIKKIINTQKENNLK